MSQRWRAAAVAVAGASALLLAGCGTRLPNSAFVSAGQQYLPGAAGSPSAGPNGSTGPGAPAAVSSGGGTSGPVGSAPSGGKASTNAGNPHHAKALGNFASDTGVSATEIKVGIIGSFTNAFDPTAFIGPHYGAEAYFTWLNEHGGVHGRKIVWYTCNDQGTGSDNVSCVHSLIDDDHVFAFAGSAIFQYAGASYVNQKGVPDIAGQPIDTAYDQYYQLWELYGDDYPKNGQVGWNGRLYGGTEVYRFFKVHFPKVPLRAGVVYYNESSSQRYGQYIAEGLRDEGYQVWTEEVDFALPDFDSAVIDMKRHNVQYVYDALDSSGNESLCSSMDRNGLYVTAKVTTTESWVNSIKSDYSNSPRCRNSLYATGNTLNYEDTSNPEVAAFRSTIDALGGQFVSALSEWELEGWASAQWLADAAASCGADLTRKCVDRYMARPVDYDGHGLLTPRRFGFLRSPPRTVRNCINVVHWQDSAYGGRGGWVDVVPNMDTNCFDVPNISYAAG
jgi:branched-chain amino acid transport system substrate-binding protein